MIVKITLKERKQKKENENRTKYITMRKKIFKTIYYLYYLILLYMLNHNNINDINKIFK